MRIKFEEKDTTWCWIAEMPIVPRIGEEINKYSNDHKRVFKVTNVKYVLDKTDEEKIYTTYDVVVEVGEVVY